MLIVSSDNNDCLHVDAAIHVGRIHETKLPMQELELKMQGGVIAGFYGIS